MARVLPKAKYYFTTDYTDNEVDAETSVTVINGNSSLNGLTLLDAGDYTDAAITASCVTITDGDAVTHPAVCSETGEVGVARL